MHIEKILLRDVGPFDDVTIEFPKGTDPQLADVYLLTGPNGTGKSTILYALAAVIGGGAMRGATTLGRDLLRARMRSRNALVAFRTDDALTYAAEFPEYPKDLRLSERDPFDGPGISSCSMRWTFTCILLGSARYFRWRRKCSRMYRLSRRRIRPSSSLRWTMRAS
jgi:hypothetical protein